MASRPFTSFGHAPADPTSVLTTAAVALLRTAPRAAQSGDARQLRALARDLCAELRADGEHAEDLIVRVKQGWATVPETSRMERAAGSALLGRIVSLCIEEYYAGAPRGR